MVHLILLGTISLPEAKLMEAMEATAVTSSLLQTLPSIVSITYGMNIGLKTELMVVGMDVMVHVELILHFMFRLVR